MNRASVRDRFMPWAGLALGRLGAAVAQQLGADSTFQDCTVGSPWVVIAGTIIGLALIGAGTLASWRVFGDRDEGPARRLIAAVSLMAAALFAIATVLPFISALIIPGCWA
ncbi:MAG: hypothetical protein ACJ8FL_04000 [Sphingomicrobium sp.]